jgi:hypothetical protein
MRRSFAAVAALLALALDGVPARADVVFTFAQTGSYSRGEPCCGIPPGPLPDGVLTASGWVSLSDDAFARGVDFAYSQSSFGGSPGWDALGVTGLSFSIDYAYPGDVGITLADLYGYPVFGPRST